MISNSNFSAILANYESAELVRLQFKRKHGRSLGAAKAHEVCSAFTQARGYMIAAKNADRMVRPLLSYYGVLSLARGLTLFLSKELRECGLAQAHGLSVDGWGDELSRQNGNIANLRTRLNGHGTLRQLIDATGHQSYLRNNCSAPNLVIDFEKPPQDSFFSLSELMSRIPEVGPVYRRWRDDKNYVPIEPGSYLPDGRRDFRIGRGYTLEDAQRVLGDAASERSTENGVLTIALPGDADIPSLSDVTGHWDVGDLVAMLRFQSGIELSKISTAFCVSYVLGMLVRYYPAHWIAMLQNRDHDAAVPTLLASLEFVEHEFPRYVVEFLERPDSLPKAG